MRKDTITQRTFERSELWARNRYLFSCFC